MIERMKVIYMMLIALPLVPSTGTSMERQRDRNKALRSESKAMRFARSAMRCETAAMTVLSSAMRFNAAAMTVAGLAMSFGTVVMTVFLLCCAFSDQTPVTRSQQPLVQC